MPGQLCRSPFFRRVFKSLENVSAPCFHNRRRKLRREFARPWPFLSGCGAEQRRHNGRASCQMGKRRTHARTLLFLWWSPPPPARPPYNESRRFVRQSNVNSGGDHLGYVATTAREDGRTRPEGRRRRSPPPPPFVLRRRFLRGRKVKRGNCRLDLSPGRNLFRRRIAT